MPSSFPPSRPGLDVASRLAIAILTLAGCASGPPVHTLQLRAFLGAAEDGSWAYAEVGQWPGASEVAQTGIVRADGSAEPEKPLPPEDAARAVEAAIAAGREPVRSADTALAGYSVDGFDRSRAHRFAAESDGTGRWNLEPLTGVASHLEVALLDGLWEVRLALDGGPRQATLARLARAGKGWVDGLLVLPGARRALLLSGSVSRRGPSTWRTEAVLELELGRGLSALLDARALDALRAKELAAARADLERAVGLAPADPVAHYNLACALALSGEEDRAILALGRAMDLDGARLGRHALRDPDLEALRHRVEFRLMVEPRRGEDAE